MKKMVFLICYWDITPTRQGFYTYAIGSRLIRYRGFTHTLQGTNSSQSPIKFQSVPCNEFVRPLCFSTQSLRQIHIFWIVDENYNDMQCFSFKLKVKNQNCAKNSLSEGCFSGIRDENKGWYLQFESTLLYQQEIPLFIQQTFHRILLV